MIAVDVASKSLLLRHSDPLTVRSLIDSSRLLDHSQYNLAVRHTLDATKVLRNLGIPAPAPIKYHYRWPGKFKRGGGVPDPAPARVQPERDGH